MHLDVPILVGRYVRLEPLAEDHREGLRQAAEDERIWQHTLTVAMGPGFDAWFNDAIAERIANRKFPFAVQQLLDGRWIGSTSYIDWNLKHRRVEVGSTWYHPSTWGTAVNPECKLLLLTHAFEVLSMNRVAFCTDLRNERSQAAIAKLGAQREGICRAHFITQGGRIRDSVIYGMTRDDWLPAKARLLARLEH